jgi:hypothetical protein
MKKHKKKYNKKIILKNVILASFTLTNIAIEYPKRAILPSPP